MSIQAWVLQLDDPASMDVDFPSVYLDRDRAITDARQLVEHYNDSEDPEITVEEIGSDHMQFINEAAGVYVNLFEVTIKDTQRQVVATIGESVPAFQLRRGG